MVLQSATSIMGASIERLTRHIITPMFASNSVTTTHTPNRSGSSTPGSHNNNNNGRLRALSSITQSQSNVHTAADLSLPLDTDRLHLTLHAVSSERQTQEEQEREDEKHPETVSVENVGSEDEEEDDEDVREKIYKLTLDYLNRDGEFNQQLADAGLKHDETGNKFHEMVKARQALMTVLAAISVSAQKNAYNGERWWLFFSNCSVPQIADLYMDWELNTYGTASCLSDMPKEFYDEIDVRLMGQLRDRLSDYFALAKEHSIPV